MTQHMYADFLTDPQQYEQAERFWSKLFDQIVAECKVEREWVHPWLNTRFADGTAFGDGDPIFSAWSPGRRVGLRIIQLDPGSGSGGDVHARFDQFDADGADPAIRVLVISCVLDAEVVELVEHLMRKWVSSSAQTRTPPERRQTG